MELALARVNTRQLRGGVRGGGYINLGKDGPADLPRSFGYGAFSSPMLPATHHEDEGPIIPAALVL